MARYRVTKTYELIVDVEAENEEEATANADSQIGGQPELINTEVEEI